VWRWGGVVGMCFGGVRDAGGGGGGWGMIIGDAMSWGIRDPRFRDPCIRCSTLLTKKTNKIQ